MMWSTEQLLHGRLRSTTAGCRTTALSKRAPAEVLLAVLVLARHLLGKVSVQIRTGRTEGQCGSLRFFRINSRGSCTFVVETQGMDAA